MSSEEISTVRFGVFVQGRGLRDWEWKSVELLRAGGASCLFILVPPDTASRRPSAARALDGLVLRIAGLPAESGPEVEEPDLQCYQPSMTCVIQRTAAGEPALSSKQQQQLLDHGLKFILFFGAGEVPQGLSGCAELGVWRFTRSSGAAKLYPFIHGLHRRDDVVSFGLEQVSEQEGRRRILLNGHFRARGERNRSVATQILSEASRWPLRVLKHVQLHGDLPCCADTGSFAGGRRHSFVLFLSLFSRDAVVQLASKLASSLMLETWNVGLVRMNFRALLAGAPLSDVTLLPRLKLGHYVADPFILSTTPELTLLVEDYTDFGVGRISEMTVRDPFGTPEVGLKVRLESKHHMRRERRENCVGRPWLPRNPAEC